MLCLRLSKQDRYFSQARERLNQEYDIVSLLQQLRFFKAVTKELIPHEQADILCSQTERLAIIDSEDPSESKEVPFRSAVQVEPDYVTAVDISM